MEIDVIKSDLYHKIDDAREEQVLEIYGLITNYLNSEDTDDEWNSMPPTERTMIEKGLAEANMGLGTPLEEVNRKLMKKYGLDG